MAAYQGTNTIGQALNRPTAGPQTSRAPRSPSTAPGTGQPAGAGETAAGGPTYHIPGYNPTNPSIADLLGFLPAGDYTQLLGQQGHAQQNLADIFARYQESGPQYEQQIARIQEQRNAAADRAVQSLVARGMSDSGVGQSNLNDIAVNAAHQTLSAQTALESLWGQLGRGAVAASNQVKNILAGGALGAMQYVQGLPINPNPMPTATQPGPTAPKPAAGQSAVPNQGTNTIGQALNRPSTSPYPSTSTIGQALNRGGV